MSCSISSGGHYVEVDIDAAALKGRIVLIGALAARARSCQCSVMGKRLTIEGTRLRGATSRRKADAIARSGRCRPLLAAGTSRLVVDATSRSLVVDAYDLAGVRRDLRQGHPRLPLKRPTCAHHDRRQPRGSVQ
jgi:NADPH:quinone reductase-like Zn-dependent oxidoreductase